MTDFVEVTYTHAKRSTRVTGNTDLDFFSSKFIN